jgi:Pathogenicity locus.
MNPNRVVREKVMVLTDLPNVGPSIAGDLARIGITAPGELAGRDPLDLYQTLCRRTGARHDPCVLDVFISVTRFMDGDEPKPWWAYTGERKRLYGSHL